MTQKIFDTVLFLEPFILPLIGIVVLVKIVLFLLTKNKQPKWSHIIYYENSQIVNSQSLSKVTVKIVQNCLSFYLLFLVSIDIILNACAKVTSSFLIINS
jgi:hypothetical protein